MFKDYDVGHMTQEKNRIVTEKEQTPMREIESQLDRLDRSISRLHDSVSAFESRLRTVVIESEVQETIVGQTPESTLSPLGGAIRLSGARVDSASDRLSALLTRLAL